MLKANDQNRLIAKDVTVDYEDKRVITSLSAALPDQKITVIIGPNACGKSTLLRTLARLEMPTGGRVILDGKSIHQQNTKHVAQRLGLLPQTPIVPDGILVKDLVARGRTPHSSLLQQWTKDDEAAVQNALAITNIASLQDRYVDELSGGQRQRVWIALSVAQDTEIMLLDEPTTYLDLPHQIEVLKLTKYLNIEEQKTIVLVLHDINLAARFADHIIAMKNGAIVVQGQPKSVITDVAMKDIFDLDCLVVPDPVTGTPMVVPKE